MKRLLYALLLTVLLAGCIPLRGSPGIGDPMAPQLGNGGYDVKHYNIVIDYDPANNFIRGLTTIEAVTSQLLGTFNLDFVGMEIAALELDGVATDYRHEDHELIVIPNQALTRGQAFTVTVAYQGTPQTPVSLLAPSQVGWFQARDGSVNVLNYPDGAATWFPCNDHYSDKATFHLEVTIPSEWYVLGPGDLVSSNSLEGRTTYVYDMNLPMSTTSTALQIDDYEIQTLDTNGGPLVAVYVAPDTPAELPGRFSILPEAIEFFSQLYGPYPFDRYSVALSDPHIPICASTYGMANSEQTVVLVCPNEYMTHEMIIAHELSHQWFGLSVTPRSMSDIWLVEGFATYSEWLWSTRDGGMEDLNRLARQREQGYQPQYAIGKPPAGNVVVEEVYTGGALLLHALRLRIGDEAFFASLRTYQERFRYALASTDDFIAVVEEASGQDLGSFFNAWLNHVEPPGLDAATD